MIPENLDKIMHLLVIREHGEEIVQGTNEFHWIIYNHNSFNWTCLLCKSELENLNEAADNHALKHLKEYNLTVFL